MSGHHVLMGLMVLCFAGCATPKVALKTTLTGGDAYPRVQVGAASQVETSNLNFGDTVAFAPGSMRVVVPSQQVQLSLIEDASVTRKELQKQLVMNRRETSKIEVMKGRYEGGGIFSSITIDLASRDPNKFDIDLVYVAFNRGDKAFRGDLSVYDFLPPELAFKSADSAYKYRDQRQLKGTLAALPYLNLLAIGMKSFKRTDESIAMEHESLEQVHKYTFRRVVLEPQEAVGFTVRLRYQPPTPEELAELRMDARPLAR